LANEIGDQPCEGDEGTQLMSKGARLRLEKKRKEEEEHKKRMAALKSKKATAPARPKFDRSKLAAGFMTNAKKAKDEVAGWALDFDNDSQNIALPKKEVKQHQTSNPEHVEDSERPKEDVVQKEAKPAEPVIPL
jgi:hypothetical protein